MTYGYGSDALLMPPFTLAEHQVLDSDAARFSRYRTYLDFYNGQQWTEKRRPGERRLTVNYTRAFVQKGVSYLMGRPVRFELVPARPGDPASEREAQAAEAVLQQLWDDNGLALTDYDAAVDAAVLGDCAFKVTRGPDERPVVRACDVMGLRAGWRADDLRSLLWVNESYSIARDEVAAIYGYEVLPAAGGTYDPHGTLAVEEHWTAQHFRLKIGGQVVAEYANPYGFIPYVIVPNLARPRQFWGLSDLEDIMTLNSEFNVRVSILSQLLQMSGNPVLVLENVDTAEGLRVGPGAIWTLPEGAKASLLEMLKDGGVQLHLSYIELLYKMMHDLSELPGGGFGRTNSGSGVHASSGVAIELLLYPVVQKVERKRRIWDDALNRRNRMLLRLAGLPVLRSRFIWPDVLPRDRAALVTQEVGLVASNIHSLSTARHNLGDEEPDLENEAILRERTALGLDNSPGHAQTGIQPPVKLSGALVEGLSQV